MINPQRTGHSSRDMKATRLVGLSGSFVLVAACGGTVSMGTVPSDTGAHEDAANASTDAGSTDAGSITPSDALTDMRSATSSLMTGRWVGYLEAYKLPSGSDALSIELTELEDGTAIGIVVFGTKSAPPPPTNPNVGYPADLSPIACFIGWDPFRGEGFRYTIGAGVVSGKRLKMRIQPRMVWQAWCELQTSYSLDATGLYGCLPNWGWNCSDVCSQDDTPTGTSVPRDCGQLYLCAMRPRPACDCNAKSCTVIESDERGVISFDVNVVGDDMNGGIAGFLGDRIVHLTREK